jgi:hypothetical protein
MHVGMLVHPRVRESAVVVAKPGPAVRYCQIYCQIRGRVGLDGDKNSFYFNNLLIPKVTAPSSNPSLSANNSDPISISIRLTSAAGHRARD